MVVFNRSFQPVEDVLPIEPLPVWKQSWFGTVVRQSLVGLAVLLLVLMVLRPAAKRLMPASAATLALAGANADSDDTTDGDKSEKKSKANNVDELLSLDPPPVVYGDILNMARAMAAEDPKRVAKVVKDWVTEQ